ncbi:PREDICTED: protein SUPPRESSOR OF GENE SILENCING 3 isoform X1 [Theobroma cacao]|uniref:Protein SUPPRESSOR OF GENE SILENCING 3 isoform X1 n=2 Tax=Theobroma cacao TaxID=3641 RepID=A0AB32VZ94_THECC|nr:PREDICTED: protein SUPPRESSOR OF GENE SILENCING 3 isoform X1 [Theobroma cacao]XP_017971126.1 PREDICTED: protein SUPPRESSOR OF GENE SILENCING 3 isoform X1 [Theobroma cacao]
MCDILCSPAGFRQREVSGKIVQKIFMADAIDQFPDLGSVYKISSRQVNQLSQNVADIKLASTQDGDKENSWESKNRVAANSWFRQDSTPNAWGHPNVIQKLRMQSSSGSEKATGNVWPTQNAVSLNSCGNGGAWSQQGDGTRGNSCIESPSAEHGWNGPALAGFTLSNSCQDGQVKTDHQVRDISDDRNGGNECDYDGSDVVYDSEDLDDYESDSDEDEKSHETRKKSKWFNGFFEILEKLTVEEIISPVRKWHCPACQGGPGAINWYRGVQPLMTHAMTKTTRRAKMHRVFADLLVEEMRRRGTFIKPVNDAFGRWEGLNDRVADHEIVWPPMVIIVNTRYEQDENGKWTGMGNQELLNYFSSYAAVKARHSYGPQGHRGMSVLIFESSAAGYLEAARLHKHFKEQGRDRDAWDCSRVPFCPGGKRQLYGYIAMKEDLDIFNRHSQGKSKLKFETKSYQEMVESQIKKINDDSQQLTRLKKKVAQEQQHSQALAESLGRLSEKLRQTTKENYIMRQRTRLQHEQNKEELGAKEQYFKEKINIIYQAIDSKEDNFEKLQRAARERVKQSNANPTRNEVGYSATEMEENARSMIIEEKKMEAFDAEREKLMKSHQDRRLEITQRYWEELIELEKGFENELTLLMEKYTPDCLEELTYQQP